MKRIEIVTQLVAAWVSAPRPEPRVDTPYEVVIKEAGVLAELILADETKRKNDYNDKLKGMRRGE